MPCESEFVEISMMIEISGKDFLGIISLLVGLLDGLIIFLISDRTISESAVVLGYNTCQREVLIPTDKLSIRINCKNSRSQYFYKFCLALMIHV